MIGERGGGGGWEGRKALCDNGPRSAAKQGWRRAGRIVMIENKRVKTREAGTGIGGRERTAAAASARIRLAVDGPVQNIGARGSASVR